MPSFTDSQWSEIRKEFGIHCIRHRDLKKAKNYCEQSIAFESAKLDSVFHLANTQAKEANLDDALKLLTETSNAHEESFKNHFKCNLQECDSNYERNAFEKSLLLVVRKAHKLEKEVPIIPKTTKNLKAMQIDAMSKGPKLAALRQRANMIAVNFDDIIGKKAGNCLFEHRKYFDKIVQERAAYEERLEQIQRNKSKIFINSDDCDVVSLFEENFGEMSIKDGHRMEHLKRIFAQCYMKSAWQDFEFINRLKKNKVLSQSTQNADSRQIVNREIQDCTEQIANFISQLHARCPLYSYRRGMFSSQTKRKEWNQITKFRMQYQTRRDMFTALDEMHRHRADGKLHKLIKVAEHELGFHYQIKPKELMPRKREFTTEICNLIGLSYLDRLLKLSEEHLQEGIEFLASVFEVSIESRKVDVAYVFGDQTTYRDPAEPDTSFLVFKRNINRLEKRVKNSRMSVEKCYLYHEMGKQNLRERNFDDTRNFGRKVIDEADMIGNYLWKFLGLILITRAEVMQKSSSKIIESLNQIHEMVGVFNNQNLQNLIQKCLLMSQAELKRK